MSFQHNAFQHNAFQTGVAASTPAPFVPVDFPPIRRSIVRDTFLAVNIAVTALTSTDVPRSAVATPAKKVSRPADWVHPNLLTTTLASAAVADPFVQDDDSRQVKRPRPAAEQQFINLLTTTLFAPIGVQDNSGQVKAKPRPAEFIPPNPAILPQSTEYPPGNSGDYQQVERAKQAPEFLAPNLLGTTLASVVDPPFVQVDNSGQVKRPKITQELVASNLLASTLTPPFVQMDDSRQVKRAKQAPEFLAPNIAAVPQSTEYPPGVLVEFSQVKRLVRIADLDVANLLTTTLTSPFAPIDLPAVRRPIQSRRDESANLLGTTLAPVVPANPFMPIEFGRQVKASRPVEIPTSNLLTSTLGQVVTPAPFVPIDFSVQILRPRPTAETPTPNVLPLIPVAAVSTDVPRVAVDTRPPTRKIPQEFFTPNLLVTTLAPIINPFSPVDWSIHVTRRTIPVGVEYVNVLALILPTEFAIDNRDFTAGIGYNRTGDGSASFDRTGTGSAASGRAGTGSASNDRTETGNTDGRTDDARKPNV